MLVAPGAVNLKNSRYRPVIKERGDNGRQHGNFCQRVGRASQPNYFTNMSPVDLHSRRLSRECRIFLATRPCALTIPRSSISESVQKLQLQRAARALPPSVSSPPLLPLPMFPRGLVSLLLLFLRLHFFLSDSVSPSIECGTYSLHSLVISASSLCPPFYICFSFLFILTFSLLYSPFLSSSFPFPLPKYANAPSLRRYCDCGRIFNLFK